MDKDLKMWSYRIVHDLQFAPNPFKGVLTLATCKPVIRKSHWSQPGVWIAGFAANSVTTGIKPKRGEERLIYLAKISRQLPLSKYWDKYPLKRAINCSEEFEEYSGDNIYSVDENGNFILQNENHHDKGNYNQDVVKGKNVLICDEFYYFAPNSRLLIPSRFDELIHKTQGQKLMTNSSLINEFISFVKDETSNKIGIFGKIKRSELAKNTGCHSCC